MALGKLKASLGFIVTIYIVSPIIFRHSPFIQRSLLFMNHVNTQYGFNLSHPEGLDIKCTRTLRLGSLGVWHILPESSLSSCVTHQDTNRTSIEDELAFIDSRKIVLYIHGNGGTRAADHRSRLYKRLAYEHDNHIIAFDYRGYGDSDYLQPTAGSLTSDARFMYDWLLSQTNVSNDRIIVWGHSLGTAVAVRMVANLPQSARPSKLILEAPFDSVANAVANHPFSAPFRIIPYFEYFFIEPIERSPELNFDSAGQISSIKPTPIMILHAEDDKILPIKLGRNLYSKAAESLGKSKVKFVQLSADHGLGHKHICNHDEAMTKVKQFVNDEL